MTYVLEQNGIDPYLNEFATISSNPAEFTHSAALNRLAEFNNLQTIDDLCPSITCGFDPDPVKATESMTNTARGYDLWIPTGWYTFSFEAKDLPSGTYLYRLTAGTFTRTDRRVLLK